METFPSDCIVMRSVVEVIPTGDIYWEYWLVSHPLKRQSITREEAQDYIHEHGLVEMLDCEHGQIWDKPDKSFQKKYKGFCKKHYVEIRHLWD